MKKIEIDVPTPEGMKKQEGTLVEYETLKEPWAEYELEDGTTLKVKNVVMQIIKLNETDPCGNPVYTIQSQPVVSVFKKAE